jgi:hypothetical protein
LQTLGPDNVGASRSRARSDLRVGRGGFLAWKGSAEQKGGDRANRQINPTERRLGGFRQIGGQGHSHAYRKVAKRANETAEQSQIPGEKSKRHSIHGRAKGSASGEGQHAAQGDGEERCAQKQTAEQKKKRPEKVDR